MKITTGLTEAEEITLVNLLGKVGQPWSEAFYNALAPLMVAITVEVVCLRRELKGLEVLLIPRPETDKHYPRQLHSPGTLLRVTDSNPRTAIKRVLDRELGGVKLDVKRVFHDLVIIKTLRGVETPNIYFAEVSSGDAVYLQQIIPGAAFYPVNDLPPNTLAHHRPIIAIAAFANAQKNMQGWKG